MPGGSPKTRRGWPVLLRLKEPAMCIVYCEEINVDIVYRVTNFHIVLNNIVFL